MSYIESPITLAKQAAGLARISYLAALKNQVAAKEAFEEAKSIYNERQEAYRALLAVSVFRKSERICPSCGGIIQVWENTIND